MTQWVQVLATKPEDPSSTPGFIEWKERAESYKPVVCLTQVHMLTPTHHTHKLITFLKFLAGCGGTCL